MREPWVHVGRLWTNGDPFLAVDAELRGAWHGFSDDEYQQIIPLGWQVTSVPVGTGRALLVGADGVVRDDDLISLSQIEDEVLELDLAALDVGEIVRRARRSLPAGRSHQIEISLPRNGSLVVMCDENQVLRALTDRPRAVMTGRARADRP